MSAYCLRNLEMGARDTFRGTLDKCPQCGRQTYVGQIVSFGRRIGTDIADSFTKGPVQNSLHTARYMAIACAAFFIFGILLNRIIPFAVVAIAGAAYWVLTAWWVYLDAAWRRMDAIPWALLTLVTNVFGLATYMVIRYPEPKSCPQCGAGITIKLKRCPYCGSETECTCPRCQASVNSDWKYCPACALQLPEMQQDQSITSVVDMPVLLSIRGTVVDARNGLPIPHAEVKIDSKTVAVSTYTNSQGTFLLEDLRVRPYVLVASCEGYEPKSMAFTPNPLENESLNFLLIPRIQPEVETLLDEENTIRNG